MSDRARVCAVTMARDEWPMVAVAVCHALVHHAEVALVVDDGSCDATPAGVAALQVAFPDRVRYARLDGLPYVQAAVSTIVVRALRAEPAADWVYFVDADEFGVGGRLDEVLAGLSDEVQCASYEVRNFVAPSDFDARRAGDYRRVRHRARAFSMVELPGRLLADQVEHGDATFFDAPFGRKVVIRRGADGYLSAGHHRLIAGAPGEVTLPTSAFSCAHLPFTGVERLAVRATHGQRLADGADDPDHGWQSRMIERLAVELRLEEFWERHSMGATKGPEVVDDDALADAIAATLDEMSLRGLDVSRAPLEARPVRQDLGSLELSMRAIRDLIDEVEMDQLDKAELAAVRHEAELRGAKLDEAAYDLAILRVDRESLLLERSRLLAALEEMRASRTWRIGRAVTTPLARLARRRR
jgi:hypothetical protein